MPMAVGVYADSMGISWKTIPAGLLSFLVGARCWELSGFLGHCDLILWLGLSTLAHETGPCVCLGWKVRQGAQESAVSIMSGT